MHIAKNKLNQVQKDISNYDQKQNPIKLLEIQKIPTKKKENKLVVSLASRLCHQKKSNN